MSDDSISKRSYSSPEFSVLLQLKQNHPDQFRAMLTQLMQGTSYEAVRQHFERYGLLDEQVRFVCGWFRDSLPVAPIAQLALLRLDADLYDSTFTALTWLYPKLADGGYVIVDDYRTFAECRQAVHDYLTGIGITVTHRAIDENAVFWRKRAL
jgi:hypothetical protein